MFLKNILSSFQRLTIQSGSFIAPKCLSSQTSTVIVMTKPILLSPNSRLNNGKLFFSSSASAASDTSSKLMQFFDDKNNWLEGKVKHGRAWSLDELRLKSNTDLHNLWYVLHKERNMLLTMEEIYAEKKMPMPSHERIAKVKKKKNTFFHILFVI
jgi:hypothetical protein